MAKWQQDLYEIQYLPFNQVKDEMAAGIAKKSFTSTLLDELDVKSEQERNEAETIIRNCATVAYGGASDTTISASRTFILAMVLNPDVQKRAQSEINRVVTNDRLPDFGDRSNLPYITALMKEVLRWHSPAPQGIPHKLSRDDQYRGYHLPTGTLVMLNVWHILHDPSIFKDPEEFHPERHLSEDPELAAKVDQAWRVVFGFGKRTCPGQPFAEDFLWLLFARLLSIFVFSPDPNNGSPTKAEFESGPLSHPMPFRCSIRVYSQSRAALLDDIQD